MKSFRSLNDIISLNFLFRFASDINYDGIEFGKITKNGGKSISANGMNIKKEKGMNLKKSY